MKCQSVHHPAEQTYGLPQAIVVDVPDQASTLQIKQAIGSAAAH
jgi:DNA-binding transcriptional regulator LsrR (DeoR family)